MGKLVQLQDTQATYVKLNEDLRSNHSHAMLARRFFEKAVKRINEGFPLQAMSLAREALIYAKYAQTYQRVYIHSFLAMTNLDFGKTDSARIHCWQALQLLDENHGAYDADKRYLNALYEEVESKTAKRTAESKAV